MTEQGAERSVLEGAVSSLIFQNEENGYTILRLDVGEEEMTVVGSMPGVSPGEYLTVQGQWVRHATYGVQFRAVVVERRLPQGMKECTYEFDEEEIICTTAAGEQRYSYEQVFAVVSDMAWYVIFFDASHGIILDKNGFSVGDARDFKAFIGQHTQLPIQEY